jgi:1-acyl-sn-glycerol-3-phosphate acyltransferase
MMGAIRIGLALLAVGTLTIPLAALQAVVLRTGRFNGNVLPKTWHRLVLKALGTKVRVVGQMTPQRPLLIAANHVSWADIMVLGSIVEGSFIAKSELTGWPVMGALSHLQRSVYVARGRRSGSRDQVRQIAERLADGDAMVLFAEGTTADGNTILPFKSSMFGAAQLALEAGQVDRVFVQPVAISYVRLHGMPMGRQHRRIASWIGDSDLVPHLIVALREGAMDVEVEFGEPVEFTSGTSRKTVAHEIEQRVRGMRAKALRRMM